MLTGRRERTPMAEQDVEKSAMIALLPTVDDWCKIDLPHMTLVYAGEVPDLPSSAFNEMAKDAASLAMMTWPITLKVIEVAQFGEGEEKVNVLRLRLTPELVAMRRFVDRWNRSDYRLFNPHATIGPVESDPFSQTMEDVPMYPMYLSFDRIMVAFGTESMTFWLKR